MENNAVKWTPMQAAAIETRNKTLLVSAAAGSGKTAVLTERIVKRLCDNENPADISRMLVVTYTKAAANELKARISKAVSAAIADDPGNKHLRKQLLLLTSAKISTIHSFCFDVIKKNLKKLGLPGAVSVANAPEILLLSRDVMTKVIDDAYNGVFEPEHVPESFLDLADIFSPRANDNALCEALISLYSALLNYPESIDFLKICSEQLKSEASLPIYKSAHGKIILAKISSYAGYLLGEYNAFEPKVRSDNIVYEKYAPLLSDEISFLASLKDNIEKENYDLAEKIFKAYSKSNLPPIRNYTTPLKDEYQALRKLFKENIIDRLNVIFNTDPEILAEETMTTAGLLYTLYCLLYRYDKIFSEEKKRLGRLDFSDLERYALDLLVENGKPTDIAREFSDSFDEIYIDEYQDTNFVQDMIFSSISKPDNRFMVGDIKQSIYGFRGAAPENFSNYRDSFPVFESTEITGEVASTIFLANNFRCDKTVIDFCNTVFSCIFRNATGRVTYYDSDDLVCSKSGGNKDTAPVNIVLAGSPGDDGQYMSESDYIAHEIKRLLTSEKKKDGTLYKPSDIAILTKVKASSVPIEKALNNLGIKTSNSIETEFFENSEILLVMSLLNTIDNPMRDIYLAGTLKSPLFSFTLDDLVTVRAFDRESSLYEALVAYTDETGFEKGKIFLEKLSYFRTLASGTQVDRLIRKLYHECGLFSIVASGMPDGSKPEGARDNLMLLYKYARDFESSSFKGLSSFIKYIDDIIAQKTKIPVTSSANGADSVQIMTIHHSKGLEFPVVFVASSHKAPNTTDRSKTVLIDKHAGASVDIPGILPGMKRKTFHKTALEFAYDDNMFEENMRVVYVALTRARERLYITGEYPDPKAEYETVKKLATNICPHTILKKHSHMRLVLIPIIAADYESTGNCAIIMPKLDDFIEADSCETPEAKTYDKALGANILKSVRDRLDFRYPFASALDIPAKLSVSDLSDGILDTIVSLTDSEASLADKLSQIRPDFASKSIKEATAADRGTATHIFMQFCDFDYAEKHGVEKEIKRMLSANYFTEDTAELISRDSVSKFFDGSFYNEVIKKSCKLWREYRFNVELPASAFSKDCDKRKALSGESLFVQGIIDCFVENSNGTYTLIDYKTDHMPFSMLGNEAAFENLLAQRHCMQLTYYKRALEIITKKPVEKVVIYSFALNKAIDITNKCNFPD